MARVRVVTDSACDLSDELLSKLEIGLVSLRIRFGSEEFVDRAELSNKEFWARCASFDGLPETSAPSPGQFQEAFEAMTAQGADGVVCITISSKMSATIESASQAGREVEPTIPVRIIDSLNVTLGQGLVVIEAAEAAAAGAGIDEVAAAAMAARSRVKLYGSIDTLENLKKGGRIGGAQALLGSLLSIKPVIQVVDGVVEEEAKPRTRSKSLRYLADKARQAGPMARLGAMNADAPDMDEFLRMIEDISATDKLLVSDIGPVIGTHAGPGAVGLAWLPA